MWTIIRLFGCLNLILSAPGQRPTYHFVVKAGKARLMDIEAFIIDRIRRRGSYEDLGASFIGSGLLDSFEFIELVADIEVQFSIRLNLANYNQNDFITAKGLIAIARKSLADSQK